MVNVFDYDVFLETPILEEIAEELEGVFHVIAHAEHASDLNYIKDRQQYFSRRYGKFLEEITSNERISISDVALFHVIPAYDILQGLLKGKPSFENIRREAEDAIYEHLEIEHSFDCLEMFEEARRMIVEE